MVAALRDLGAEVGFDLTAKGIETAEQEGCAVAAGFRFGQGYRYSGPVALDALLTGSALATR